MAHFPDLARVPYLAIDTEGTGVRYGDKAVGLSYSLPDGTGEYLAWGHRDGQNNCTLEEVKRWVAGELQRPDLIAICHNAQHDLSTLAYDGMTVRARVEDTGFICALLDEYEPKLTLDYLGQKYVGESKDSLAMYEWLAKAYGGRPVAHGKKGQAQNIWKAPAGIVRPYAIQDAHLTRRLWEQTRPLIDLEGLGRVYETEVRLIPVLLRMHLVGVRVSREYAEGLKKDLLKRQRELSKEWDRVTGGVNPRAPTEMAPLFDRWGIPYPKTPTGQPSFAKAFLETVDHPLIAGLLEWKKLDKMGTTFMDSYILNNTTAEYPFIHGEFHQLRKDFGAQGGGQFGAVGGRLSSGGDLNLQNIPSRDPYWGPAIRGAFIPYTPDHQWVKLDYSQIEYRFLAHYAGGNLRRAFQEDPLVDFHRAAAALLFGVPLEKVTKKQRSDAKNLNFGLVYGMGTAALAAALGVSIEEAEELKTLYFDKAPEIQKVFRGCSNMAGDFGEIVTWGGRVNRFKGNPAYGTKRTSKRTGREYTVWEQFEGTHKALNRLLQGSAGDMMKVILPDVAAEIDWEDAILHLTVHDEVDLSIVPGEKGDRTIRRIKEIMEDVKHRGREPLTVPVVADAEVGPDWGHVQDWVDPQRKAA